MLISMGLLAQQAHGHSSIMANYLFEGNEKGEWYLTISVPLAGLHQALLSHHDETDLWIVEGSEYNTQLALKYLVSKSRVKILSTDPINSGTLIEMQSIQTRLGDHQSDFIFKLKNVPKKISGFDLEISAMSENIGHVNIARVIHGAANKKVILQFSNNYQGSIRFK